MSVTSFTGEHRWLSNFWPCRVVYEGMEFRSVEHAYQAAKTTDRKEQRIIQIQPKPGDAKRAGRRLRSLRADWDSVKVGIMRDLLTQKFLDPELRLRLIATGDTDLIEGNTWHDNFWGECLCDRHLGEGGKNMLGSLLMQVRESVNADAA